MQRDYGYFWHTLGDFTLQDIPDLEHFKSLAEEYFSRLDTVVWSNNQSSLNDQSDEDLNFGGFADNSIDSWYDYKIENIIPRGMIYNNVPVAISLVSNQYRVIVEKGGNNIYFSKVYCLKEEETEELENWRMEFKEIFKQTKPGPFSKVYITL